MDGEELEDDDHDEPPFLSQIGLIGAICAFIDKCEPGKTVNTRQMNTIIEAATLVMDSLRRPDVPAKPGMGAMAWLASDDTGTSSKYLLWALTKLGQRPPMDYDPWPHDPAEVGRCVRMLDACPGLRERVGELDSDSHPAPWRRVPGGLGQREVGAAVQADSGTDEVCHRSQGRCVMPMLPTTLRYEEAAERTTATGWACKVCGSFKGDQPSSEHLARTCCARNRPCECGTRITSLACAKCEACMKKSREELFQKLLRVEWDGDTPLCEWDGDRFFMTAEDIEEHCVEHDLNPADLRLSLCRPAKPRLFEVNEWCSDDLPEDGDVPNAADIDTSYGEEE